MIDFHNHKQAITRHRNMFQDMTVPDARDQSPTEAYTATAIHYALSDAFDEGREIGIQLGHSEAKLRKYAVDDNTLMHHYSVLCNVGTGLRLKTHNWLHVTCPLCWAQGIRDVKRTMEVCVETTNRLLEKKPVAKLKARWYNAHEAPWRFRESTTQKDFYEAEDGHYYHKDELDFSLGVQMLVQLPDSETLVLRLAKHIDSQCLEGPRDTARKFLTSFELYDHYVKYFLEQGWIPPRELKSLVERVLEANTELKNLFPEERIARIVGRLQDGAAVKPKVKRYPWGFSSSLENKRFEYEHSSGQGVSLKPINFNEGCYIYEGVDGNYHKREELDWSI